MKFKRTYVHLMLCVLVLMASGWMRSVSAQQAVRGQEPANHPCGQIYTNHFGPLDYRDAPSRGGPIKTVEDFHYTPKVEAAIGGSTGEFGADINYTLRAVPNHHRALVSLTRWVERTRSDRTFGMEFPVECYFERALRFRPDDTVARALYAQFLWKRQRQAEALRQLESATEFAENNPFSHYNIGLLYLEFGQYAKALAAAHRAQSLGLSRKGLEEALKKSGHWREPINELAPAAADTASQNASSGATAAPMSPAASNSGR